MSGIQQMLLGSGGDILRLDSANYSRLVPGGSPSCSFRIDADGQVYVGDNASGGVLTARYNWVTPTSSASNYDVRWNTTAGTVDTTPGAENTNLSLGSDRTWIQSAGGFLDSASFQARIHRAGNTTNPLVTANISLEADGSP
jgi:hypothetical protein